jgi:hypothetical protein
MTLGYMRGSRIPRSSGDVSNFLQFVTVSSPASRKRRVDLGKVVGQQRRPVPYPLDVDRAADIIGALDEPGDERLDRLDRPVRVEPRDDDIGANFLAPVPQTVASYEDRVVAFLREHLPGIEPHAERCGVRPELRDGLGELVATVAPAELWVRNLAAVAIGKAEIVLAGMEQAVELVLGLVLGEPVTLPARPSKGRAWMVPAAPGLSLWEPLSDNEGACKSRRIVDIMISS